MAVKIANKIFGHIGLGTTGFFKPGNIVGPTPTDQAIPILKSALDSGATFWDAGENYGTPEYKTLHLLNAYFSRYPEDAEKVFVSVKGCFGGKTRSSMNDEVGVRTSVENCLRIADNRFKIDLFQPARLDPKAGKIGSIGLSECSAASIRKTATVHPIAAVEVELSLFSTDILRNGVATACKENNIPIIAYSLLSRGFLTGQLHRYEDMANNDVRRLFPRFYPEVFDSNLELVDEVAKVASQKGCSTAQAAIAWVSAQSKFIGVPVIPIPGTSAKSRVEENLRQIKLTEAEIQQLDAALAKIEVKGDRYPAQSMHMTEV